MIIIIITVLIIVIIAIIVIPSDFLMIPLWLNLFFAGQRGGGHRKWAVRMLPLGVGVKCSGFLAGWIDR